MFDITRSRFIGFFFYSGDFTIIGAKNIVCFILDCVEKKFVKSRFTVIGASGSNCKNSDSSENRSEFSFHLGPFACSFFFIDGSLP